MGQLLARIWTKLFDKAQCKIVLVGLNNAGKTTTLYQLHLGEVVATQPTIGSNVEEIVYKNFKFCVWDLGGQESLRPSWSTYYLNSNAIIMVVDSTDKHRLPVVKEELFRMVHHEDLANALVLIYANKQDLKGALPSAELSNALCLHEIRDHEWHIQGCCALTGEGLYDGLEWLSSRLKSR
nr:Arl5 [Gefionella okellyi]